MYDNSKYAYIVGRLRALETQMVDQSALDRLLEAPGASEAFRTLNDLPLVAGSMGDYGVQDFNKTLVGALQEVKRLLLSMAPYPEVLDFLWHKYDFHNAKIILKAKLSGHDYQEVGHALSPLGRISADNWERHLMEGEKIGLTEDLSKMVRVVSEDYEKNGDLTVISSVLDQHYLEELEKIARRMGSPLILSYLKRLIDFSNLLAFIRVQETKKDEAVLARVLVKGGYIPFGVFAEAYGRSYEDLRSTLEKKIGGDDLTHSLSKFMDHKMLISAEKKAQELQQEFMSYSKQISFGPEPVFAFFWRFENHMMIIRAILVGKLNGLSNEIIQNHVLSL
ncbi:V-type ATPase subunit [Patescibacteria group bacterium]|nr:V-type ATPase subunit [Patescibacteria group bacterium]MBU1016380.1 V-type ATPase subunit [Patescibacteria group bacterium]MBU1685456.1 V-type ATPase subunit [Patescibacteria group bacterium]MBU1938727.1 V-type ATPase subunit [Patescibacteria group bacterium]